MSENKLHDTVEFIFFRGMYILIGVLITKMFPWFEFMDVHYVIWYLIMPWCLIYATVIAILARRRSNIASSR